MLGDHHVLAHYATINTFCNILDLVYCTGMNKLQKAQNYFATQDTVMHTLLTQARQAKHPIILPTAKPSNKYFATLVNSIISQQISTKAAATIYTKLEAVTPITPQAITAARAEDLRACGCSQRKVQYMQSLAQAWDTLEPDTFTTCTDEEIITRLSSCYGIGKWTAEMFLIFAMAREDIFAIGDLGLRQQVAASYHVAHDDLPKINTIATTWKPYRTIASLALWHQLDNGPVLL